MLTGHRPSWADMEIRLLGPVSLQSAGHVVELGPVQQRAVLAALAADAGRPVSTETLVHRVWDETPPDEVRAALYAYISRLRRLLAPPRVERGQKADTSPIRLAGRGGGYILAVDPEMVDLHRFTQLLAVADRADIDHATRWNTLQQALQLWSGTPLADLSGEWATRIRTRLFQQRLDAAVRWAEIELRHGTTAGILGPVRDLLMEYPLAEPLVSVLMRALVATGRGAEAMECFARFRAVLADQLGVEPGPQLRSLHQLLLRADSGYRTGDKRSGEKHAGDKRSGDGPAASAHAAATDVPAIAVTPRLAQLPRGVPFFVGRAAELAWLNSLADMPEDAQRPGITAVISGIPGVGKSALAIHWAHLIRDRFPDGQLYVNLRGFDPSGVVDASDAVRGFLTSLGVTPERMPAGLDAESGLYRSLLADKRVLLVLDNACDAGQVRPLLPGTATTLVVVTSRNQLPGLIATEGGYPLALDVLSADEARELLTCRLGASRLAAEPAAVQDIIDHCGGLPLALAVVAARAATHPRFSLPELAAELRDDARGTYVLAGTDPVTDLRGAFLSSYRALTSGTAELFRLLALHPGPEISTAAAASLSGSPERAVCPHLSELATASLILEPVPGRYRLHDLARAFAHDLADAYDSESRHRAANRRLTDYYLHTAYAANRLLQPHREPIMLTALEPGAAFTPPTDQAQAMTWFDAERQALLTMVNHAAETHLDAAAWRLAWTLSTYLDRNGQWRDWAAVQQTALLAAQRSGDTTALIHTHRQLAGAYTRLGRSADALNHYQQAFNLQAGSGDVLGQARSRFDLGWVSARQGLYRDAIRHTEHALTLYREAGHRRGEAQALNTLGWCHAQLGDYDEALGRCRQALVIFEQVADQVWQAATWDSLGYANHQLGRHPMAIRCYGTALELFRRVGDRYEQADTLTRLGETHCEAGTLHQADVAWRAALTILDDLNHPSASQVRAKLERLRQSQTG